MSSKPYNAVAALTDLIDLYWDDPVAFSEDMLGFDPDDWRWKAMADVSMHPRTSIRSGQGVGKTAFEALLLSGSSAADLTLKWFVLLRPNSNCMMCFGLRFPSG